VSSTTARIDRQTNAALQQLAGSAGETKQTMLERAIKEYQAKCFRQQMDTAYRALRADSNAWEAERAERHLWDSTLMDGLEADENWTEDGNAVA